MGEGGEVKVDEWNCWFYQFSRIEELVSCHQDFFYVYTNLCLVLVLVTLEEYLAICGEK